MNNTINSSTIDLTIDQSQKQEMVHSLYTKLRSKDLTTSKDKTQAQLSLEKSNMERAQTNVDELTAQNKALKRQIKLTKEALLDKQRKVRQKEKRD